MFSRCAYRFVEVERRPPPARLDILPWLIQEAGWMLRVATGFQGRARGRVLIELVEPLDYREGAVHVRVPQGFVSDGASVPRWLWWLAPPFGEYQQAAVLHDWLCCDPEWSWREAAEEFRRAMKTLGVAPTIAWGMYWAVRLRGAFLRRG